MVWIHYELCESIWGGSPATASIETGIESTDIESPSINKVNESSDCDEVNIKRVCTAESNSKRRLFFCVVRVRVNNSNTQ